MSLEIIALGASGFVGSNLCSALKALGHKLECYSGKDLDLTAPSFQEKLSQILSPKKVLVFISALTPDRGRGVDTMMKNLTMAENVAACISKSQPSHLVYISSDAVYSDEALVRETTLCDPQNFHGIMHITREKILQATVAGKYPLTILRPCAIYGAGDTHNSYGPNQFIKSALTTKKVSIFGEGEEIRDHLYIDDFIAVTVGCIERQISGILNVASGKAISFGEVAKLVCSLCPGVELEKRPRAATNFVHRHFDITKLIELFPNLKITTLNTGLSKTIRSSSVN